MVYYMYLYVCMYTCTYVLHIMFVHISVADYDTEAHYQKVIFNGYTTSAHGITDM